VQSLLETTAAQQRLLAGKTADPTISAVQMTGSFAMKRPQVQA